MVKLFKMALTLGNKKKTNLIIIKQLEEDNQRGLRRNSWTTNMKNTRALGQKSI